MNFFRRCCWYWNLGTHGITPERARWIAGNGFEPGSFLASWQWQEARYKALKANDGRCECCGRSKHDLPPGEYLVVDHIRSRADFPWLALNVRWLQCICTACNRGKGRTDQTDWRAANHPHREGQ